MVKFNFRVTYVFARNIQQMQPHILHIKQWYPNGQRPLRVGPPTNIYTLSPFRIVLYVYLLVDGKVTWKKISQKCWKGAVIVIRVCPVRWRMLFQAWHWWWWETSGKDRPRNMVSNMRIITDGYRKTRYPIGTSLGGSALMWWLSEVHSTTGDIIELEHTNEILSIPTIGI